MRRDSGSSGLGAEAIAAGDGHATAIGGPLGTRLRGIRLGTLAVRIQLVRIGPQVPVSNPV